MYRVDAVWLGPPRATFPWRARYVSYGVGLLAMMFIMFVQRRLGIGLDFFSVAWALVGTVLVTRILGKKIDYERPLGQVLGQFWAEVTGPRSRRRAAGGAVRAGHVRVRSSNGRGLGGSASAVASGGAAPAGVTGSGKASPVRIGPRRETTRRSVRTGRAARGGALPAAVAGGSPGRPAERTAAARAAQSDAWRKAGSRGRG